MFLAVMSSGAGCFNTVTAVSYGSGVSHIRGVAQWLARMLWEHDVAGSTPATPTRKNSPFA